MRRLVLLIALMGLIAPPVLARPASAQPSAASKLAQAGSTGGAIGKRGKSVSGGERPATRTPTKKPQTKSARKPKRAARRGPTGPKYLGCYKDQGSFFGTKGRDLDGRLWSDSGMTIAHCVAFCRSQGFRYAGIQVGRQCFCGNSYGKSGKASNCNRRCRGDKAPNCGGSWANSVYRVR